MDLAQVTPLILTYNEAPNIARTLAALAWATRVIVLDSGSTDQTDNIVRSFSNVRLQQRIFDSHSEQWNYGLALVQTEWALTLDADYVLGRGFEDEIHSMEVSDDVTAFFAGFTYCVFGHPLRASLYPPRALLFKKECSHYVQDGHTQRLVFNGTAERLRTTVLHDDRKPLSRWLSAQDSYARLEAHYLLAQSKKSLCMQDRLRLGIYVAPFLVSIYLLLGKGLIFEGWRGWFYVMQRTLAEMLLSVRLLIEKHQIEPQS